MKRSSNPKISFHYLEQFAFRDRERLKRFLLSQFKRQGRTVEAINYVFCNDAYLFEINKAYLKHFDYTDIITFELSPNATPLVADIYISIERVKENAALFHSAFKKELHRVIFHGCLHLLGYTDKSKEDSQKMRALEDEWLKKYFVPREKLLKRLTRFP